MSVSDFSSPFVDAGRRHRIRSLSRAMALACRGLAVVLPLLLAVYWFVTSPADLAAGAQVPAIAVGDGDVPLRLSAFVLSLLPMAGLVYGLWQAADCFTGFAEGALFARPTTLALRNFAFGMGVWALLTPISGVALSVLLSWGAPAGQRQLVLSIGSNELLVLLFAAMVAIIGWVLAEASVLADENAQFI